MLFAVLALGAAVILVAVRAHHVPGGIHGFPLAAPRYVDPARAPHDLYVAPSGGGYDGQAFYHLSLDPFTRTSTAHGIRLDAPAYRAQRVGFPALVWLVRQLGVTTTWAMVTVNVLATAVTAGAGAALARRLDRPAWVGSLLATVPGATVALGRDTSEATDLAFLTLAMLALASRRRGWLAVALTAAALTRETALLLAVPVAGCATWEGVRHRSWPRVALGVAPLAVVAGWQLYLRTVWGTFPWQAGDNNLGAPLAAAAPAVKTAVLEYVRRQQASFLILPLLALAVLVALLSVRRSDAPLEVRIALVLATILALCLSHAVWQGFRAYLRAVIELTAFAAVTLLAARPRRSALTTMAGTSALSGIAAAVTVMTGGP